MAIAIHGSSPAMVFDLQTTSASVQTAQFSPPANSVLVAMVVAVANANPTVSGGSLTWLRRRQKVGTLYTEIWTAPCVAGATNIRITAAATNSGPVVVGLKVDVYTGADLTTPAGSGGTGVSSTNNATITGYTSTVAGSRGVVAAGDANSNGTPTSTDDEFTFDVADFVSGLVARKAANTGSAGSSVTFNLDAGGTGGAAWEWTAFELLPGNSDASPALTTVTATTTVPSPTVSTGSSSVPATVTATTSVPAPTASGSANATPATVTATVAVPAPAVTTDSATVVDLPHVTAAATVPAPTVQTNVSLTPATVQAAATVWGLTVQAEFNATVTLPHTAVTVEAGGVMATVPPLPGDNMSGQPGQIEFNGFILGSGTPYRWKSLAGWREKPPIDSGNVSRSSRHGSYAGRPLMQERVITWTANLLAARDEVEAAVVALELALPVYGDERQSPLVINDLGTPYLIYGRIDRNPLVVDQQLRLGFSQLTLQWICSDPRRYNLLSTGITVPIDDERTIGNGGNSETHPLLIVQGPVDTPAVLNQSTNMLVAFDVALDSDEQLVIDCDLGNATVGGASVMGKLTGSSVHPSYFILDRGNNVISHTAASGGVQVDVLYRDAWA